MDETKNATFGLTEKSLQLIREEMSKYPEIESVIIFGSRSMGNYKKGSDVDLALKGDELSWKIKSRLSARLNEELPLPWFFGVVIYDDIENENLKHHIDTEGKVLYRRE